MGPTFVYMASIAKRTSTPRDGSEPITTYRVRWRLGAVTDGPWQGEPFGTDYDAAERFRDAVNDAGGQWPSNYIPGVGWVSPAEYRRLLSEPAPEPEAAKSPTLSEFAKTWVASLSGIQSDTRARYRRILALHIEPWFGDKHLDDTTAISPLTIGSWINQLGDGTAPPDIAEAGDEDLVVRDVLGAKSIRNVHGVLSSLMQAAVDAEPAYRSRNPCDKTKLPRLDDGEEDEEMVFLEPEEFDLILAEVREDARDLLEFLAGTGLRYSEATALQVRDLDLLSARPTVSVRRAWKRGDDGVWRLGPPKTPKSKRRLLLTPSQVQMLARLVSAKKGKDLVFTMASGKGWGHSTFYTQRWRPAVYKAVRCSHHRELDLAAGVARRGFRYLKSEHIVPCGCPGPLEKVPRLHDLRHSHVAWMIAIKAPLPAIQRRLGHESITTTIDRYGHLMDEVEDETMAGLELLMLRGREPAFVAA